MKYLWRISTLTCMYRTLPRLPRLPYRRRLNSLLMSPFGLPRQIWSASFTATVPSFFHKATTSYTITSGPLRMPQAHRGDAATQIQRLDTVQMGSRASLQSGSSATTDLGTREVTSKGPGSQEVKKSKQTLDYVLKTGLAGGLAGCAVCRLPNRGFVCMMFRIC